jgi:integrase
MELARHLLFNKTGSQASLSGYINQLYAFCKWAKSEPDQLVKECINQKRGTSPKQMINLTSILEEYIDHMQARNLSQATIKIDLRHIASFFRINGVDLRLPYDLSSWSSCNEIAPSREELVKTLDIADLREKVIVTMLAVSGLRVGTLVKLQYRHVRNDFERGIIPVHVHVEAEITKGKRRSYDTFLNEEAFDYLKAYLNARKKGTENIPPEQIQDESPLIRTTRCKQVKTVTVNTVYCVVHELFVKAGILKSNSWRKKYELKTHSLRRFFRTEMASLGVDQDYVNFMMGHASRDRYHDVRMKGIEYLRGVYMTSGIRIRPRTRMNKIDALKEILQTWGLDPQKILTHEALAQITPTTKQEQADDRDSFIQSETSQNHQSKGFLSESAGTQK